MGIVYLELYDSMLVMVNCHLDDLGFIQSELPYSAVTVSS